MPGYGLWSMFMILYNKLIKDSNAVFVAHRGINILKVKKVKIYNFKVE